ncbi:hypothetical protein ACLK19_13125 [Escherichia coli]
MLAQAMEHDTRGGIRMNSRYVSWKRLDHSTVCWWLDTLSEGVRGDFGSISIALTLPSGALYHHVTHLLVRDSPDGQQHVCLQSSFPVAAWHDTLTRLYNRGALFEKARRLPNCADTPTSFFCHSGRP